MCWNSKTFVTNTWLIPHCLLSRRIRAARSYSCFFIFFLCGLGTNNKPTFYRSETYLPMLLMRKHTCWGFGDGDQPCLGTKQHKTFFSNVKTALMWAGGVAQCRRSWGWSIVVRFPLSRQVLDCNPFLFWLQEVSEPSKEEKAVAKHLRFNCPTKSTNMMGHRVDYFTGQHTHTSY